MTCSNRYVYILVWCSVFILSGLFFLAPTPASAAFFSGPLVSCGNNIQVTDCDAGGGKPGKMIAGECSFCDVLEVAQNIINFLIFLGVVVATLLFCYAGVLYLFSAPSMGNIEKAHKIFWHVLIGLVITLAAWLIIDTLMKVLYDDGPGSEIKQRYGPWNEILCKSKVAPKCMAVEEKSVDVGLEAEKPIVYATQDENTFTRVDTPNVKNGACAGGQCKFTETFGTELTTFTRSMSEQGENLNWLITEANSLPTCPKNGNGTCNASGGGCHCNSCHQSGTCVDVGFRDKAKYNDVQSIADVFRAAAAANSTAVFESNSKEQADAVRASLIALYPENRSLQENANRYVQYVSHATAPHFSLYGSKSGTYAPLSLPKN